MYFPLKEQTKNLFLDFLDQPKDAEQRKVNRGLYISYSFGDPHSHKTVRIILLDTRYYKTGNLDENPDVVGKEQWEWFEEIIRTKNETFTFIASGTQILPHDRLVSEAWFTNSRIRLFKILGKYKKSGVVLLTGDIHLAQILRTFCVLPEIGYHIFEVTSSGLSHHEYEGMSIIFDYLLPNKYFFSPLVNEINFAKVEINWGETKQESSIFVNIIDYYNVIRTRKEIKYNDLTYSAKRVNKTDPICFEKVSSRFKTLEDYIEYYKRHYNQIVFLLPYALVYYLIFRLLKWLFMKIISMPYILYKTFKVKDKDE